jgi:hypothetical protein
VTRSSLPIFLLSFFMSALTAGCGGGNGGPPTVLKSITVTPVAANLAIGLTQQFVATGSYSDGSTADLTNNAAWTSSAPAIATVVPTSGLASGISIGLTTITAQSGSTSGSVGLNVTPAILRSITIAPSPLATGVGISRQLTAMGAYSDGGAVDMTTSVAWASSSPSIATVTATTGLVTGVSLGSTNITATSGSISGTTPLSVTTHTWMDAGHSRTRGDTAVALLTNGNVLLTGGSFSADGFTPYSYGECDLYDSVTNTWSATGTLNTPRGGHTATILPNGEVLVAAGGGLFDDLTSAELYDSATGTWSPAGSLTTARVHYTATLLSNGKVLVAGGTVGSSSAELYDPTANAWSAAGSLATARYYHTATLLPNGKVLVAGGSDAINTPLSSAELYDPASNSWSAVASLATARAGHTATLLPNGKVLVAGGAVAVGVIASTAELYDPGSNTWSAAANPLIARYYHTATLLPNGTILVIGGTAFPDFNYTSSTEMYDPASNSWSMAPSTLRAHSGHTATLLPNGEILVAGGNTAAAEVYW